jgi:hypothetical protein
MQRRRRLNPTEEQERRAAAVLRAHYKREYTPATLHTASADYDMAIDLANRILAGEEVAEALAGTGLVVDMSPQPAQIAEIETSQGVIEVPVTEAEVNRPEPPFRVKVTDKMLKAVRAAVLQESKVRGAVLRVAPLIRASDATGRAQTYNYLLSSGVYDITGELLSSLKGKHIETYEGYVAFDVYVYRRTPPYGEELELNVYVLVDSDGETVLLTSKKDGEAKEAFMRAIQRR